MVDKSKTRAVDAETIVMSDRETVCAAAIEDAVAEVVTDVDERGDDMTTRQEIGRALRAWGVASSSENMKRAVEKLNVLGVRIV